MRYSEYDACVECNLDLWKWESNEYPAWFKEYVVAFHNMRGLVEMHTEDAKSKDIERQSKKGKRGR